MSRHNKSRLMALTFLFIILVSTLGVMVLAQPAGSGNVHGTVLDEKGDPLSGVKVMAYSSSGGLFTTKYTDSDGYFRFALYDERYTIKFEKYGYVTEQYTIDVPTGFYFDDDNDPVKMGDIVLEQNLKLTSSVLSRVVSPGHKVNLPFSVSIAGNELEEIWFYVECPEGWNNRILDSSGVVAQALLSSGSLSLTLEITVPETAIETETVSLTVMGSLNATLEFTIIPSQTFMHDVEMSSMYPSVSTELGRTISFPMTISNQGDVDETIDLAAVIPEGWTVSFITSGGMEILSLFLESGDSEALTFEVEPPEEASVGDYLIDVEAFSEGELLDSLVLRVRLREVEGEVELLSAYTDVTVEAGNVIEYPVTIWNKGDNDDLFLITVLSAPTGWKTVFKSGEIKVSSLLISGGSSANLVFEVSPPSDYEPGSYSLIVLVESEEGGLDDTLILGVNLEEASSDVEIVSTFTDVMVQAGNTIAYPLRIRNNGESDSQLRLSVLSAPVNWDTTFTSDGVEITSFFIDAGESLNLKLEAKPPRTVETGDYSIVIQVESDDGTVSEEIVLMATVVGSFGVELELSTLYTTITIGDSVEFTVDVTNNGFSPITTVYLETVAPEDWEVSVIPSQVSTLDPRDSIRFTVVAETPSDTVAGDYLITVEAVSDQAESDESDLRVTAKASTSWGFIGIGLAGVAIIGLIIAFTRFKRR